MGLHVWGLHLEQLWEHIRLKFRQLSGWALSEAEQVEHVLWSFLEQLRQGPCRAAEQFEGCYRCPVAVLHGITPRAGPYP